MRVLVADDDALSRRQLEALLEQDGHEVVAVADGATAWSLLQRPVGPRLAILDWLMPAKDGIEICRLMRQAEGLQPNYVIMLTSRDRQADKVAGLQSGANDYVTKPYDPAELRARVHVGRNILQLQQRLAAKVAELEHALAEIQQLRGLLPICSYCLKIRDDRNYWKQIDQYFMEHSELRFSHGVCPDCWQSTVAPQLEMFRKSHAPVTGKEKS
ncbi:MAG: response regulator transcription factor [Gemmataceae bacterium]